MIGRLRCRRLTSGRGTGELTGISGTGGLTVDADGVHHIWFDYELD
ncbi:DUF3224 domain-containing protein [Nocardia sp. CA-129566]